MKTAKLCLLLFISLGCIFAFANSAWAGTTVIHVDTEDGGDITDNTGSVTNQKGAMFWNGTKWVTNDTAAHMYFTDLLTGLRLKDYDTTTIAGSVAGPVISRDGITATRSIYTYTAPDKSGGAFVYEAVQYDILQADGKHIILRSRGTGHGTGEAYFDIYIEDPSGGGITAMRADPVWFEYSGLTMDQALAQTSETEGRKGELTSPDANYFLDSDGGSDMAGITFQFHTGTINYADALTPNLRSSFPIRFSYKYMSSENNLIELSFLPTLVSETHSAQVLSPTAGGGGGGSGSNRPTVLTFDASSITGQSALLNGSISARGSAALSGYGFAYSTNAQSWTEITVGSDDLLGSFSYDLSGLAANTKYYFKAYAANSAGTVYGSVKSFLVPEEQNVRTPGPLVMRFYIGKYQYYVNDLEQTMDTVPLIYEERTLLPVKYVAENLGAVINWDAGERKVTITLNGKTIEMWIDKGQAAVNGVSTPIDPDNPAVAPIVQEPGRTMLPLRFIAETLGCTVDWNPDKQEIKVTYPGS